MADIDKFRNIIQRYTVVLIYQNREIFRMRHQFSPDSSWIHITVVPSFSARDHRFDILFRCIRIFFPVQATDLNIELIADLGEFS